MLTTLAVATLIVFVIDNLKSVTDAVTSTVIDCSVALSDSNFSTDTVAVTVAQIDVIAFTIDGVTVAVASILHPNVLLPEVNVCTKSENVT